MKVNAAEHHLIWEAMGPALIQKAESLGMETNNLHEGLPQRPSQGYVDAKLYAARMRYLVLTYECLAFTFLLFKGRLRYFLKAQHVSDKSRSWISCAFNFARCRS